MRPFAPLLLALAAPAAAIPPPLPPPDEFAFAVDGVTITCRLPRPGGPLVGCIMQDSIYLLSITVQRRADGSFRYDAGRTCLQPSPDTEGFEFAYRNGVLAPDATVAGSDLERDLQSLLAMRIKPECEAIANWPHQIAQIVPSLERAFAIYRSLRFE